MARLIDCNIVIIHLKEAKKNYHMDICRGNFQRIQNGIIIIDKHFETIYYFPESSSNHEVQAHMKNSNCRVFPSVFKCLCSLNQQKMNIVLADNKCAYATDKTDSFVQIFKDLSNKYGQIFYFEYDALNNCLKEKSKSKNGVKDVISLKHTETFHSTADCSNTKCKSRKMKTSTRKRITALMPRRKMKEELDNQKYFPDSEIMVEISTCPIFRTNNRNPPSLMEVVNSNIDPYSLSEVHSSLGEIVSDCAEPDSIVVPSSPQPQPSHQTRTREYAAHNATVSNNNPTEIRLPEEESSLGSIPASIHCAQEQNANRQRLPKHPRYSTYDSRIASYATFREFRYLDTKELATTGLFYTGKADEVQCFQCGIEHRNWTPDKDPLLEHIRESPDCLFLEMHLGVNTLNQYKTLHDVWLWICTETIHCKDWMQAALLLPKLDCSRNRKRTAQIRSSGKISRREPFSSLTTIGGATIGTSVTVFTTSDQSEVHNISLTLCAYQPSQDGHQVCNKNQNRLFRQGFITPVLMMLLDVLPVMEVSRTGIQRMSPGLNMLFGSHNAPLCRRLKVRNSSTLRRMTEESDEKEGVVVHSTFQRNNHMANPPDIKHLNLGNDPENDTENDEGDTQTVLKKNDSLKSIITCIECKTKTRNTLFLPCSHHCLCQVCAEKCSLCPVCKKVIQQKIKTFMI